MGVRALSKIQIGQEATPGTAVSATALLRAMGFIEDQPNIVFVDETVGILVGTDRTVVTAKGAQLSMEGAVTFEQIMYLLAAAVANVTSGTQDGTGSDYIWQYDIPTTTTGSFKTFTIEAGDDVQAERIKYAFVQSFTLRGDAAGNLTFSATWIGHGAEPVTFTAGLSVPDVEDIPFALGKLFIDDASGAYGTTQVANRLIGFEFNFNSGLKPRRPANGSLEYARVVRKAPEVTLSLTFDHESDVHTEKTKWRSETPRLIRVMWEGSSVATPGTSYSKKTLIIDLPGKWEKFDALGEDDGVTTVSGTFRSRYNATVGDAGKIIVVNEVSTLP